MRRRHIIVAIILALALGRFLYLILSPYAANGAVDARRVYAMAVDRKDIAICDKVHLKWLGDITNEELKGSCYISYAAAYPEENVCPRMDNDCACIRAQAVAASNPSKCLVLSDWRDRIDCVYSVAGSLKKPELCNSLQVDDEAQRCIRNYQIDFGR